LYNNHSQACKYLSVKVDELVKRPIQHFFERQRKKLHRKGARIPMNDAYLWYAAVTGEEGQHSIWAFYEAVKVGVGLKILVWTVLRPCFYLR